MKPELQRIKIAEACGWTDIHKILYQGKLIPCGDHKNASESAKNFPHKGDWLAPIPDYLNSLDAMHEAEKVLIEKGVNAWWEYVGHINRHNPAPLGVETAVHATAAQRAEAFLRTLSLWQE